MFFNGIAYFFCNYTTQLNKTEADFKAFWTF